MSAKALNPAHFPVRFPCTYHARDHFSYKQSIQDALSGLLREPLGIDPAAEVYWYGVCPNNMELVDGATYRGAIRINSLLKTAKTVSYSYILLDDDDQVVDWSDDLRASYATKPSAFWFRINGKHIKMTDDMRAAIKSLVSKKPPPPRKPRAQTTP